MRGGGDRAEQDLWRATHVSRRMAQLGAILAARDAADMRDNFQALADVQRHHPDAVADLVSGPQVGAWAAVCLRFIATESEPLHWAHRAHLGAIAASAAVRTGYQVRVHVPVRAGFVYLPTLGRARITGARNIVECQAGPDGILLDGRPPESWEIIRSLKASAGGIELNVQLDDIDPYWSTFGISTSARLRADAVAFWQHQLETAWQVLADRHAHRLSMMATAIRCLVPVESASQLGSKSASSADAPGAVALSEPVNPTRLAATLVHESQHFRLASLHNLRDLYVRSRQLYYSPWRNDPRPLSGILHGLFAFLGVAGFWSRERSDHTSELEYARHARQLRVAHRQATTASDLTPLGSALVAALGEAIAEMPLTDCPEDVRRIADDLVTEHQAAWRLHNLIPPEATVRAFHHAWLKGHPLPTSHSGAPTPTDPHGEAPLTRLAIAWLENEAELRALVTDRELFTKRFPGMTPTDLHLIAGRYHAARDDALATITEGTANTHIWATLVVTHARACKDPAMSPLVRMPEVVRAAFIDDIDSLRRLMTRYAAGTSISDSMRR
jgi:HEXXH motif-containing protein